MTVRVEKLVKWYGSQKALNEVSFSANKGEILGFLGPNGAGKSTTMKILAGYMTQSSGKASVNGFDVSSQSLEARKHIGYLPELNPVYGEMFVKEYLHFVAEVHQLGKSASKRVDEMIEQVGLTPERKKRIGQLSKGYKQRVGLAQAILHNPEVLILDEPTSGLDPNQVLEIRQLIKDIGKNKTVIFSTHIMQEVEAMCNRVVIINKGVIVADDRMENLQTRLKQKLRIEIELKNPPASQDLMRIKGVEKAENSNSKIILTCSEDIRERINEAAFANQWGLLSIHLQANSMEEIFQSLTK
jgi:ABC-2 type transport system ATP-binding protein